MFAGNFVIYTRCSTEEQLKTGFSHEYQLDSITRFMAVYKDCDFVGVYSDTTTGTNFERPELLTLYNFC